VPPAVPFPRSSWSSRPHTTPPIRARHPPSTWLPNGTGSAKPWATCRSPLVQKVGPSHHVSYPHHPPSSLLFITHINKHRNAHTRTRIHTHTNTYAHEYTRTQILAHTNAHAHEYTHTHAHTYEYTPTRICTHTNTRTHEYTHTHTNTHTHAHTYEYTPSRIRTHTHTHTHAHEYTHTLFSMPHLLFSMLIMIQLVPFSPILHLLYHSLRPRPQPPSP